MIFGRRFPTCLASIIGVVSVSCAHARPAPVNPATTAHRAAAVTLREATAHAIEQLPDTAAYQALRDQVSAQQRASRGPFVGPPVVRGDVLLGSDGFTEQEAAVSAAIRWPGEARAQRS